MTPEQLANGIKELFINDAVESYKEMYVLSELPEKPSQYQQDIQKVLSSLDSEGKVAFFNLIEIICTYSATSFCSFLDGSCGYIGQDTELKLVGANNPEEILNGELMTHLDESVGNN
jgi:hypothetical protein